MFKHTHCPDCGKTRIEVDYLHEEIHTYDFTEFDSEDPNDHDPDIRDGDYTGPNDNGIAKCECGWSIPVPEFMGEGNHLTTAQMKRVIRSYYRLHEVISDMLEDPAGPIRFDPTIGGAAERAFLVNMLMDLASEPQLEEG